MVKTPLFKGSCTALVTPLNEAGIDYERLKKNIDFQYENGTAAVVICGTTGENAVQSQNEHDELVRVTVNHTAGRMKVIAGIGSNDTAHALTNAQNAKAVGADGVLMVTPYYNKSTQKGLIEHFSYVADRVEIPMILYNVPSRTGIGISAQTYKTLSEHPNINGVKEASGDFTLIGKTIALCGDDKQKTARRDLGRQQPYARRAVQTLRALSRRRYCRRDDAVSKIRSSVFDAFHRDQSHPHQDRHAALRPRQRSNAPASD